MTDSPKRPSALIEYAEHLEKSKTEDDYHLAFGKFINEFASVDACSLIFSMAI